MIFTTRKQSLRRLCFTHVCHSVHRGECLVRGVPGPEGCLVPGGSGPGVAWSRGVPGLGAAWPGGCLAWGDLVPVYHDKGIITSPLPLTLESPEHGHHLPFYFFMPETGWKLKLIGQISVTICKLISPSDGWEILEHSRPV